MDLDVLNIRARVDLVEYRSMARCSTAVSHIRVAAVSVGAGPSIAEVCIESIDDGDESDKQPVG